MNSVVNSTVLIGLVRFKFQNVLNQVRPIKVKIKIIFFIF